MPTECSPALFEFARVEGRDVVAGFDGGRITSDAGALLLGATDRVIALTERFAACFRDARDRALVEHSVATLVRQRVIGIALGYEDLVDHDELRHDPVMAVLAGKLAARRAGCAPLAGKSTLNRLELGGPEPTRYARISADPTAIEALFVDLFLDAHTKAPAQITLDLDATDDPLHGHQGPKHRFGRRRLAGSSTATTIATVTCRSTSFAAAICWQPSCGGRISMAPPGRWKRSSASSGGFAPAGRVCGSCSEPIAVSPARR